MISYGHSREALIRWLQNFLDTPPGKGNIIQDFAIIDGVEFMTRLTITTAVPIEPYVLVTPQSIPSSIDFNSKDFDVDWSQEELRQFIDKNGYTAHLYYKTGLIPQGVKFAYLGPHFDMEKAISLGFGVSREGAAQNIP